MATVARADRLADTDPLVLLLAEELEAAPEIPLSLPMPSDRRVADMVERASRDPGNVGSVTAWCATAPASRKTVERVFLGETGLTPQAWLRQAKLIHAVSALSSGRGVGDVAHDLGYATPSAFTYMFRCCLGAPPSAFSRRPA